MKKILLLLFTAMLGVLNAVDAQVLVTIGSNSGSNGGSFSYPQVMGNYYWGQKNQSLYTAAELSAAGLLPGAIINGIGYNVVNVNACPNLDGFTVGVKTTTTSSFTAFALWETGLTNIFAPATGYQPVTGWNMFTIGSPIVWNGTDNLLIETCSNNNNWLTNGSTSCQWTTGLPANLSAQRYEDVAGVCANTTNMEVYSTRQDLRISYIPPAGCIQPVSLTASSLTSNGATLSWTNPNSTTPLNYDIFLVAANGPAPTASSTPYVSGVSNPYVISGLLTNTAYDFYVKAHCTANDSSAWGGVGTFTTLPTCPQPTTLSAANVTSSSADLNWTAVGSDTLWELSIGLSPNTNPTPVLQTSTKPYSLTGLPSNTCFDYHVRAICGPGDTSSWSGPFTFCTSIGALGCTGGSAASIIFTENFTNTNATQTDVLPTGWTRSATWTGNRRWYFDSNQPSSGTVTGPAAGAPPGSGFAYFESSVNAAGQTDTLISPNIALGGAAGAARVKFFRHMFGANTGRLTLLVEAGATQTVLWTDTGQVQTSATAPWDSIVVSLNSFVGQNIKLRFAANPGTVSGFESDMAIDNISVEACISCPAPSNLVATNVTGSSADIGWTPVGSATAWDIYVVAANSPAPTASTTPTYPGVTTNPSNITGLTQYQTVDVYVRSACGGTSGNSSWAGPLQVLPCAPLAGTYTIDPLAPASATNFQTFAAVKTALLCGVSAPVMFNMAPATKFTTQVEFVPVPGSSATNTITFNGNGDTITNGNTAGGYHTIQLNGADNFRFNNMVVEATGAQGFAMHLFNGADGTNNNQFKNCTFQVPIASTSTLTVPFAISGSLTSATTACTAKAQNNIVDSCVVRGGYYGMTNYGSFTAADYGNGNQVKNTQVVDFYAYGIYYLYQDNYLVSNNRIHRALRTNTTTFYGIYASGTANNNIIERNRIHNPFPFTTTSEFYGIQNFSFGSVANATVIKNNLIENVKSNAAVYGIYSSFADNCSIYFNTVVFDNTLSTGGLARGIWINSGVGQVVQNNNIYITKAGAGVKHGIYNTASPIICSHNNVFITTAATNHYGYNGSANRTTLAAWQASTPSVGAGSLNADPLFTSAAPDYSPSNPVLNNVGTPIASVTNDYFGAARGVTPDIGAFEFSVAATDIATTSIISPNPSVGCYTATDTIKVQITNFGSATIDFSLNPSTVTANVTGTITASATAIVNTGTLAPLATRIVTLSPTVNMSANGAYTIAAYSSTVGDPITSNDTLAPVNYSVNLAAGTLTASPDQHCVSGVSTISLSGNMGGFYQFQSSSSATGPWTNVGSGGNSYTSPSLTSTTYYRAIATCNANSDSTNVDTVIVNNPMITSTMGDTVCGTDTVNLMATSAGGGISWYADLTSQTVLDTGMIFSTVISATDTFYAAAGSGGGPGNNFTTTYIAGNGASGNAFPIKALKNITIDSFAINCTSTLNTPTNWTIQYRPDNYILVPGANTSAAGWTVIATLTGIPSAGSGLPTILPLPTGIPIPVGQTYSFQIAATSGSVGYTNGTTLGNLFSANADLEFYEGQGGSLNSMTNTPRIFNGNIFYSSGCTGSRVPVIAVSTPGPAIDASATDSVVCAGDQTTLLATGAGVGGTYVWNNSGVTGVPFTPTATVTYKLTGTNASGCSGVDSITITHVPQFYDTVNATPNPICLGGSVTLTAADSNLNPPPPYCLSGATNGADTKIDTVIFAGVATGSSLTNPETYTDNTAIVIPAAAGVPLPLRVRNGSASNIYYGGTLTVYIDYNHNGVFDASELVYTFVTTGLNTIPNTTVTIPTTALNGLTRMRFVFPESNPSIPCGTWVYGETEDYTVNITGATNPTAYTWSYMPGSLSGPVQTLSPTSNTTYVVTQTDANGCTATTSVNVVVNPLPAVTASITPSTTCFNTTAVPTGGGANTYSWTGGLVNNQAFVVNASASYTVTGTDANGCTATSTASVTVTPSSTNLAQAAPLNVSSTPGSTNQSQAHPDGATVSYYDASCNIIASVNDGVGGNVLGNTISTVNVDATVMTHNGQPYAQRWYQITPTNNGPAAVTLYYTQADFNNYNGHLSVVNNTYDSLPTGPSDAVGIARMRITQISGGGLGVGTVTAVHTPTVVWNAPLNRWEATISVIGFSQFFLHAGNPLNIPLAVELHNFTVVKNGSVSDATWFTMMEQNNSHFNVQRSTDGRSFKQIGRVNTKAVNGNSNESLAYNFTDEQPQIGHNYYRLEQVDHNGNMSYSNIIDLVWGAAGSVVTIYPNPATDKLNIDLAIDKVAQIEVRLLDMSGRVVRSVMQRSEKGMNNITFDMSDVASGVYGVQIYENSVLTHSSNVSKQMK